MWRPLWRRDAREVKGQLWQGMQGWEGGDVLDMSPAHEVDATA